MSKNQQNQKTTETHTDFTYCSHYKGSVKQPCLLQGIKVMHEKFERQPENIKSDIYYIGNLGKNKIEVIKQKNITTKIKKSIDEFIGI